MNLTPYRFHEFYTPTHPPFDNQQFLWFTIIGEFIAPIVKDEKDLLYWFCFHGKDFQLCFISADYQKIEEKLEAQKKMFSITSKTLPKDDAKIEFDGSRWLAKDKIGNNDSEVKRAKLVLNFLHSTCELLIDNLLKEGSNWRLEKNEDKENPLGNIFESLAHLVTNISHFEFELRDGNRTDWMPAQPIGNTRLHL